MKEKRLDLIHALIKKIIIKPEPFLGQKNIYYLHAFLNGYILGLSQGAEDKYHSDFLAGFQQYVEHFYHSNLTLSWASLISMHCTEPKDAF